MLLYGFLGLGFAGRRHEEIEAHSNLIVHVVFGLDEAEVVAADQRALIQEAAHFGIFFAEGQEALSRASQAPDLLVFLFLCCCALRRTRYILVLTGQTEKDVEVAEPGPFS